MALYLARYLNVPPADLPGEGGDRLDDLPAAAEEIRAALLDTFDRQQQVDAAGRLAARHLMLGHPPESLIATLAHALLREDAGFHAYQMLEAGSRHSFVSGAPATRAGISSSPLHDIWRRISRLRGRSCRPQISPAG